MTLGTKSLLFGVHQIFLHPLLVLIAWVKLYKSFPSWRELICIFIHDWGYWGVEDLKSARGDRHPEYGGKLARRFLGYKWEDFILGHSTYYVARNDVPLSKLMAPDKYWHCMIPFWFFKLLAFPSGEFKYYRGMQHSRQVADQSVTDEEWWAKLQERCHQKMEGTYTIDKDKLD